MKRINLFVSCFLLVMLVFSSCTKDNIQPQERKEDTLSTDQSDIDFCIENADNPYEYVGVEHNAALDAIAADPNFGNLSIEEAHAIANQSVTTNLEVELDVPYDAIVDAYALTGSENALMEAAEGLLESGQISPAAYEKIAAVEDLLANSEDPIAYGEGIVELENQVMADPEFTETERAILLGGMSVARHSACYWTTAALDADSPWHAHFDLGELDGGAELRGWWSRIKRAFRRVVRFIRKDISGYKYAYRYSWIFTSTGWKRVVISVIVGVVYSWIG